MISFDNPFDIPFDRWLENVRIGKMIDERIRRLEVEKIQLTMEAKNAKDRVKLLEARVKELEDVEQAYDVVYDGMKKQIWNMSKQLENAELAIEALKAKLKRKNEQIQRLTEANTGYNKGIRRLRKRISDMERIAKIHKDGLRNMRQQVSDLMKENRALMIDLEEALEKQEGEA